MTEKAEILAANSPTMTDGALSPVEPDDLPPFASLTTDEDRERKAESRSPGTYNVVVNPDSFQHLPEYSDDLDVRNLRISPLRRGSTSASMTSGSQGRETAGDQLDGFRGPREDPNVVILRRFEDATRRATFQRKESRSSSSPRVPLVFPVGRAPTAECHDELDPTQSLMQRASDGGPDSNLLLYFRKRIWRQLAQIESGTQPSNRPNFPGIEVLEHAARFFPPVSNSLSSILSKFKITLKSKTVSMSGHLTYYLQLFHAMMAVAALSLAHKEGNERLDALQHYQKALPALQSNLRSADDLSSDGAFLTHFLLLVYEVSNMFPYLHRLNSLHWIRCGQEH